METDKRLEIALNLIDRALAILYKLGIDDSEIMAMISRRIKR